MANFALKDNFLNIFSLGNCGDQNVANIEKGRHFSTCNWTQEMMFLGKLVFAKLSLPASKGCRSRMVTSPLYDVLDHKNHTFSESYWSKEIKTDITKCLMHKYTNTKIQHMTKCQKDPTCGIFLKRGLFKDIKNHILMC